MTPWGNFRRSITLALEADQLTERSAYITGLSFAEVRAEEIRRVVVQELGPIEAAEAVLEDAASKCWPPPVS